MTASRQILVTGGTGRHGGTGRAVIRSLVARGMGVRAFVRQRDERAEALATLGAEIVVGDFADHGSLVRAMDGVESAYFCYPVGAGICEAAGLFAAAAKQRGLKRIVDLSLAAARPDSPSPQGRAQWVAESIFDWAGLGGVHLRIAAFFMENLLLLDAEAVRRQARIANAFGDHPLAWISGEDVGALAAALIADPGLADARVLTAGGVERASYPDIAALIGLETGRPVAYAELTPDAWRDAMVAGSRARGEENARGAAHLAAQAVTLRAMPPMPVTRHVQEMIGREPVSLRRFLSRHRAEFLPTDAPAAPGRGEAFAGKGLVH